MLVPAGRWNFSKEKPLKSARSAVGHVTAARPMCFAGHGKESQHVKFLEFPFLNPKWTTDKLGNV